MRSAKIPVRPLRAFRRGRMIPAAADASATALGEPFHAGPPPRRHRPRQPDLDPGAHPPGGAAAPRCERRLLDDHLGDQPRREGDRREGASREPRGRARRVRHHQRAGRGSAEARRHRQRDHHEVSRRPREHRGARLGGGRGADDPAPRQRGREVLRALRSARRLEQPRLRDPGRHDLHDPPQRSDHQGQRRDGLPARPRAGRGGLHPLRLGDGDGADDRIGRRHVRARPVGGQLPACSPRCADPTQHEDLLRQRGVRIAVPAGLPRVPRRGEGRGLLEPLHRVDGRGRPSHALERRRVPLSADREAARRQDPHALRGEPACLHHRAGRRHGLQRPQAHARPEAVEAPRTHAGRDGLA